MSTLTFLPYIGEHFSKEYIIPNYIGESLSSLIPGLLAMAQGLDTSNEHCVLLNSTKPNHSTTTLEPVVNLHRPNFSVSVYFFLMFVLLLFSILAFTVLNFSQLAIRVRKRPTTTRFAIRDDDEDDQTTSTDDLTSTRVLNNPKDFGEPRYEIRLLLVLTFLVTFIYYGYLPGLLSYSTMPYSPKFFNLSMNLSEKFKSYVQILYNF